MSMRTAIFKLAIRASCLKWILGTKSGVRNFIYHGLPKTPASPPRALTKHFQVEQYEITKQAVYHIQPPGSKPARHIFYLHGGAYIAPIVRLHWDFIRRLMRGLPCQVTVPLYGRAPSHTYQEAFVFLKNAYLRLLESHSPQDIIFMGDSAGGGLALAFAQTLLDIDLPQPGSVVMLSPWLDITTSNPEIAEIEKRDPLLAIAGAREAGKIWAAGADPATPQLSPVNGTLKGLAPLCLLIGTDDMLLPDARVLRNKAAAENHPLCYLEYPSMFHAWMLLGLLPESRKALQDIVNYLEKRV